MHVLASQHPFVQLQSSYTFTVPSSTTDGRPAGNIIQRILGACYCEVGFFPIDYLLGFVRVGGWSRRPVAFDVHVRKPYSVPYHGGRDVSLFSAPPAEALSIVYGHLAKGDTHEQQVFHEKVQGTALVGSLVPLNQQDHTLSVLGFNTPRMNNNVKVYRSVIVTNVGGEWVYTPKHTATSGTRDITSVVECLKYLKTLGYIGWDGVWASRYQQTSASNIAFSALEGGLRYSYDITVKNWPSGSAPPVDNWQVQSFHMEYVYESYYKTAFVPALNKAAGTFSLNAGAFGVRLSERATCYDHYGPGAPPVSLVGNVTNTVTEVPSNTNSIAISSGVIVPIEPLDRDMGIVEHANSFVSSCDWRSAAYQVPDLRTRLCRRFNELERDLTSSAFFSTSDAVAGYIDHFASNNLESLVEIGDVLRALGLVKEFRKLLADIRKGTYSQIGRDIVDILTDVKLLHSFGIAPTSQTFNEIQSYAEAIQRNRDRIAPFASPKTLYGKFSYNLPDGTFGFQKARLVTHSKVTVQFSNDTFARLWMGLRSVGLEPSASQLWDICPMSFVVDWFANMGERLEAFDNQALMLTLKCVSAVHSLKVYIDIDQAALNSWSLTPMADSEASTISYVLYRRYVSRRLPALRPSKFDFLSVDGVPDLGTAGSFVWKIFAR